MTKPEDVVREACEYRDKQLRSLVHVAALDSLVAERDDYKTRYEERKADWKLAVN